MEKITVKRPLPDYVKAVYSSKIDAKIARNLRKARYAGFTQAEIAEGYHEYELQKLIAGS